MYQEDPTPYLPSPANETYSKPADFTRYRDTNSLESPSCYTSVHARLSQRRLFPLFSYQTPSHNTDVIPSSHRHAFSLNLDKRFSEWNVPSLPFSCTNHHFHKCVGKSMFYIYIGGTRWRSSLRHCAKSRKVAGSIPDGVSWISHWYNPSSRTMALGFTQPLTEMSTRNIFWG
jgi:hypothetical protein